MKKVLRILLILVIALLIVFTVVANLNLIGNEEVKMKTLLYGNGFFVMIIAICIAFFVLLGKKKQ